MIKLIFIICTYLSLILLIGIKSVDLYVDNEVSFSIKNTIINLIMIILGIAGIIGIYLK